jgi:hypothetical protein
LSGALSRWRIGEELSVLAKKLRDQYLTLAKAAARGVFGALSRRRGVRFPASLLSPFFHAPERRRGSTPIISGRVSARLAVNPHISATQYRKARPVGRVAARVARPGPIPFAGARAKIDAARCRALPTRVRNGQQNAHRRLPPRRNAGGGFTGK